MRLASLLRLPFSISDACRLDCAADDAEPDAPSAPSPSPSPPHRLRDARSDRPLMQHSSSASVSPPANAASSPRLTIGKSPFAQAHLFDKLCAGLLLFSGGEVLLIQRSSKYNDLCWDIPGGQIDPGDITADETYRTQLATLAPAQQRQQVLLYPGNAAPTDRHGYGVGSGTWLAAAREAREELGSLPSPVSVISAHLCTRGDGSKRYTLYVCRLDRAVRARFKPTLSEEHSAWGWFPPAALAALVERGGGFSLHPWIEAFAAQHPDAWAELCLPRRWRPPPQRAPGDAAAAWGALIEDEMDRLGAVREQTPSPSPLPGPGQGHEHGHGHGHAHHGHGHEKGEGVGSSTEEDGGGAAGSGGKGKKKSKEEKKEKKAAKKAEKAEKAAKKAGK